MIYHWPYDFAKGCHIGSCFGTRVWLKLRCCPRIARRMCTERSSTAESTSTPQMPNPNTASCECSTRTGGLAQRLDGGISGIPWRGSFKCSKLLVPGSYRRTSDMLQMLRSWTCTCHFFFRPSWDFCKDPGNIGSIQKPQTNPSVLCFMLAHAVRLFQDPQPLDFPEQGFPMAFIMEQAGGSASCGMFKGSSALDLGTLK